MQKVTITLDAQLLQRSRELARRNGKSFDELVADLVRAAVEDWRTSLQETWNYADHLSLRLNAPMPSRDERNTRS
jgi:metal-responsive CopG/Arc/MetJ family transcriptional regulator